MLDTPPLPIIIGTETFTLHRFPGVSLKTLQQCSRHKTCC